MRYALGIIAFGFCADVAKDAIPMKGCCGKAAYQVAAMMLLYNFKKDKMDLYADNKKVLTDLETICMIIFNGKRCGSMYFSPTACVNDGYLEYSAMTKAFGRCELIKMMD